MKASRASTAALAAGSRVDMDLADTTFRPPAVRLGLLGGFSVEDRHTAGRLTLPHQAQRLLAVLAVTGITSRAWVGGTLWPETTEERAHSSLRTAIWQVTRPSRRILWTQGTEVALADDVDVDVRDLRQAAHAALNDGAATPRHLEMLRGAPDLLPGWYDDWVQLERESLTQLRLHALEHLSLEMLQQGRFADALALALAAVATEPLRDSAHRLVVQCHLREGNAVHALRHFNGYRDLLRRELGIPPSPQMQHLISPLQPTRTA
jgi:DNA-binding SARP family transcriptional activator